MKMLKISLIFGALGGIVILFAVILGDVVFPKYLTDLIKSEARLVRGSSSWNKWVEMETPVHTHFYIFNVTNPNEVESGTEIPKLKEVGPFVFRQRRQKVDPISETCKETVKYAQKVTYLYDRERFQVADPAEQVVNVVNLPFIWAMKAAMDHGTDYVSSLVEILRSESLLRRDVSVQELLFDGFDVSSYNNDIVTNLGLPKEFSEFRFSLYKNKNGTTDGLYEVFTGAKDVEQFGLVKKWNGSDMKSEKCNNNSGTDGTIFPPFLKKSSQIRIFDPDICHPLRLSFNKPITWKGVKGYRFILSKELQRPTQSVEKSEPSCYCNRKNKQECQTGIIDFGVCKTGVPIVLSTPHFLDSYDNYGSNVGLFPERCLHETTFDIEPKTGLLLKTHKRIQTNMEVKRMEQVPQLKNINETIFFPVLWTDEHVTICDVDAEDFKSRIQKPEKSVQMAKWIAVGIGIFLVLAGAAAPFLCPKKSNSMF